MGNNSVLRFGRTSWQLNRLIAECGWPGVVAALILLICGLFLFFVLLSLQEQARTLQKQTADLRRLSIPRLSGQLQLNPADQLTQFYGGFPEQGVVFNAMGKLYNAAAQQNLNLEQGEYRLLSVRDSKFARYDIVLPVKGGYVQVRKFIAQALAEVPTLSLEAVTFGRQKIDDSAVDAQLRMTLYLRQD